MRSYLDENSSTAAFLARKREDRCLICMDPDSDTEIINLCCGCTSHWRCLQKWVELYGTCPYCHQRFMPSTQQNVDPRQSSFSRTDSFSSLMSPVLITIGRIIPSRQVPVLSSPQVVNNRDQIQNGRERKSILDEFLQLVRLVSSAILLPKSLLLLAVIVPLYNFILHRIDISLTNEQSDNAHPDTIVCYSKSKTIEIFLYLISMCFIISTVWMHIRQ